MSTGGAVGPIRIFDVARDGEAVRLEPRGTVAPTAAGLASIEATPGFDAVLLLEEGLAVPAPAVLAGLLAGPCHGWHAGLLLGQAGEPVAWNTICHGRSMLSCDVDPAMASTSWKVSARALLVRAEVLERLGGFDGGFDTAAGAALDAGLRWIQHGALLRHEPDLLVEPPTSPGDRATAADGIRIVQRRLGSRWARWAVLRGLRGRTLRVGELRSALRAARSGEPVVLATARGLGDPAASAPAPDADEVRVSVLVPTVGRYPFVEPLLAQLAGQTRPPDEVIVVDQNPEDARHDLHAVAGDLPLRVLHLLPPGQCRARNLGLRASTGTHVLFLDDDDEIPADLIERHLEVLATPEVAVSCGLVDDAESGPAPASLRFRQVGTTFPTNNAMIRRRVLEQAGLFDPTYDRGSRADHDLGMRSYLAGNLHVYDPRPQVFHHHAPMGGLRTHGARIRTRNNSRSTVVERHLRTPTDIYLGLRYHTVEQVREDLALSAFATLTGSGSPMHRIARLVVQVALLPSTLVRNRAAYRTGRELLAARPPIPKLDGPT